MAAKVIMTTAVEVDLFTPEFKRFKARKQELDFKHVLDLDENTLSPLISKVSLRNASAMTPIAGLKPCTDWDVYQFPSWPGLMIVKNPFMPGCQGYWISRCLGDFPADSDNITNLSALGAERGQRLWQDFLLKGSTELTKADRLRQLRWTTLGYHYNWTTKEYSAENVGKFPSDVSCLSQYLAACLGFGPYKPEAAIVNYYHLNSTLAAHTDHSEQDHSAPLFSISFGQTAIFLMGGVTKGVLPLAVKLKSGDVCVMSGHSRLAYHAVPKILPPTQEALPAYLQPFDGSLTPQNCCLQAGGHGHTTDLCTHSQTLSQDLFYQCPGEDNHALKLAPSFQQYQRDIDQVNYKIYTVLKTLDFTPFSRYLKSSRININIRQVLPHGVTSL